ncbi:amidohydrolase [Chondromyces apiculatus DSM 436]|uniref:Amidohydrolase n=1 Tax=Chondromyces apiculatus DSM 436 TaxID=1192034 RepID=A0A017STD2_9BACT|nr:amidohydrolase [Chondromyces apiculatus DSM 436]
MLAFPFLAAVHCGQENEGTPGGTTSTTTPPPTTTGTGGAGGGTGGAGGGECTTTDQAIRLGKLVDPEDGSVTDNAIVVVHEDRIAYVGTDATQIPCGATIVDWSAYTGLPGLIDAHVHFSYQTDEEPGTLPWERSRYLADNEPYTLMELARAAATATLKTGVTSAFDKGGYEFLSVALRAELASGETLGPRFFGANGGVYNFEYPGSLPLALLKSWVQQHKLRGSDLIKVWADQCSDQTLECSPTFTFDELKLVVDTAHDEGLPIAIHAYHGDTAKLAIMAAPDSIEHPEGIDAVDCGTMIDNGTIYIPTIDHNRYYSDNLDFFGYPPEKEAEFAEYIQENLASAAMAHQLGVQIAMGSDAVFTGFGQNTRELTWLVQAGMTPLEALRAATINGAQSMGLHDKIGRVAVGYYADIIAVEGDPLTDINVVINNVREVMVGGRVADF